MRRMKVLRSRLDFRVSSSDDPSRTAPSLPRITQTIRFVRGSSYHEHRAPTRSRRLGQNALRPQLRDALLREISR
jgi:hypothetical protein